MKKNRAGRASLYVFRRILGSDAGAVSGAGSANVDISGIESAVVAAADQTVRVHTRVVCVEIRTRRLAILSPLRAVLDWLQRARPFVHLNSRAFWNACLVEPDEMATLRVGDIYPRTIDVPAVEALDDWPHGAPDVRELIVVVRSRQRSGMHHGRFVKN